MITISTTGKLLSIYTIIAIPIHIQAKTIVEYGYFKKIIHG